MSWVTDQAHYPLQSLTTSVVTEPLTLGHLEPRPYHHPPLYSCVIQISLHSSGHHGAQLEPDYTICKSVQGSV